MGRTGNACHSYNTVIAVNFRVGYLTSVYWVLVCIHTSLYIYMHYEVSLFPARMGYDAEMYSINYSLFSICSVCKFCRIRSAELCL